MEQRVSIVTLGAADLKRSREFYERLGWRRFNGQCGSHRILPGGRDGSLPCSRGESLPKTRILLQTATLLTPIPPSTYNLPLGHSSQKQFGRKCWTFMEIG